MRRPPLRSAAAESLAQSHGEAYGEARGWLAARAHCLPPPGESCSSLPRSMVLRSGFHRSTMRMMRACTKLVGMNDVSPSAASCAALGGAATAAAPPPATSAPLPAADQGGDELDDLD